VVSDFFHKAVAGDVEAVCGLLTGPGRAQAAGHGQVIGQPRVPVSKQRCIARRAHTAIVSQDLPGVVDRLRFVPARVAQRHARVMVCAGELCLPQLLRKTPEGWKIDEFALPVND
jgi:hypothetical protein